MPDRLTRLDDLIQKMTDQELARAWAHCMQALTDRDLVRTSNTPVGDYAERICCEKFGLKRKGFSEKSVDAIGKDGLKYQIKGRRLTRKNRSRQLSAIRGVEENPFDTLLAVFFNEELDVEEIWSIPCEVVREAPFVKRTNSTRFTLTKKLQKDPRITQVV